MDNRVAPEIVQFIEEHKLNAPAEIERMLKRDARFDSKMDNVTTQQIYNHWMNVVSSYWKLNAIKFTSAQQYIAGTPG